MKNFSPVGILKKIAIPGRETSRSIDFLLIMLITFLTWKTSYSFFVSDDWGYLSLFKDKGLEGIFEPYNNHIIPLHKLVYFAELKTFGVNSIFFQYCNIFTFSIAVFLFYKLLWLILKNQFWTIAGTLLFLLHPVNSYYILWGFQICQTLHILFQLAFFYYFIKYTVDKKSLTLVIAISAIIMQNFFFGNGIFFPLLLIAGGWLYKNLPHKKIIVVVGISLQIIFILLQTLYGNNDVAIAVGDIPAILEAMLQYAGRNILRYFSLLEINFGKTLALIVASLFVAFLLYIYIKKKDKRKTILIVTGWLAVTLIAIPVARRAIISASVMPVYYYGLSLIPFCILIVIALSNIKSSIIIKNKVLVFFSTLIFLVLFFIDQRITGSYATRDLRNRLAMTKAIQNHTEYSPFDDPIFNGADSAIKKQNLKPVETFGYWQKNTKAFFLSEELINK